MKTDINTILAAFEEEFTAGQVDLKEWVRRYPEHEREIVSYAVYSTILEMAPDTCDEDAESEARFMERARSVMARMRAEHSPSRQAFGSLLEAAKTVGLTPATLCERLGLGKGLLAKLDRRHLRPSTIPAALVERLSEILQRTRDEVADYFRLPPTLAAQASYKSSEAPRVTEQEDFAEMVALASDLTPEQKAFWLNESGGEA